jgi:hypothetical protein
MRSPSCAQSDVLPRHMRCDLRCKEPAQWIRLPNFGITIRKANVLTLMGPLARPASPENDNRAEKQQVIVRTEGYESMHMKDRSTCILAGCAGWFVLIPDGGTARRCPSPGLLH